MIKNACGYFDEIKRKIEAIWYDPQYQYWFGSDYRFEYVENRNNKYLTREFVSLNKAGEVIGFFSYEINSSTRVADRFSAINFSNDKVTFGMDLRTVIDDVFVKFGFSVLEFEVICGNPIEKAYDRIAKKMGGRILCTKAKRALDLAGNICDVKVYEILKDDYLAHR